MSNETSNRGSSSSLSEISHLFLSSVREKHAVPGVSRPVRVPPGQAGHPAQASSPVEPRPAEPAAPARHSSIDLTPEEFAKVFGGAEAAAEATAPCGPVTAVLASHLGDHQRDAAGRYARHLVARHGGRVGMIEIDAGVLRLSCFEPGEPNGPQADEPDEGAGAYFEPRHLAEAVEELNADVDRWVVVATTPRLPEARGILRLVQHWVLLTNSDSEGIVAAYRMLKGLSHVDRPRLSVATLDAADSSEAERVYRKLAGVCEQFLSWPVQRGAAVVETSDVVEHVVMSWRPTHEKALVAAGPHWQVVESFLSRAAEQGDQVDVSDEEFSGMGAELDAAVDDEPEVEAVREDPKAPTMRMAISDPEPREEIPVRQSTVAHFQRPSIPEAPAPQDSASDDVIDISGAEANPGAILDAVMKRHGRELVECPVPVPMCEGAKLAVGRDRRVTLVAVAGKGLSGLRGVGYAYRWLLENRVLVGMAVPQMAIDVHATPKLRLIVDQSEVGREGLQSIVQNNNAVELTVFRTVRWAGRTGLLLEAA